jgi:hypothetical protein
MIRIIVAVSIALMCHHAQAMDLSEDLKKLEKLGLPGRVEIHEPGWRVDMTPADLWALATIKFKELPPLEYDKPYNGALFLWYPGEHVRDICGYSHIAVSDVVAGCTLIDQDRSAGKCVVIISDDRTLASIGLTSALAIRHEIGHCNGWGDDHRGAR